MTTKDALPTPTPVMQPEMNEFWAATTRGELLLPHCLVCGFVIWHPRPYCPECGSDSVKWHRASGHAVIYSFTINRRGQGYNRTFRDVGPYIVAYVELEEGPRILTNSVECTPESVHIGMPVVARFDPAGPDAAVVRFRPAANAEVRA
jgi:uncharacterized OB-fold protein